jgi:hypothetical protein
MSDEITALLTAATCGALDAQRAMAEQAKLLTQILPALADTTLDPISLAAFARKLQTACQAGEVAAATIHVAARDLAIPRACR